MYDNHIEQYEACGKLLITVINDDYCEDICEVNICGNKIYVVDKRGKVMPGRRLMWLPPNLTFTQNTYTKKASSNFIQLLIANDFFV